MKKTLFMVIFVFASLILVGCQPLTYDDVFSTYEIYINEHDEAYDDLMTTFNTVNSTIIFSTITVNNIIEELGISTTGSGVIFDEDETYYYALTNSHVIGADETYIHHVSVLDVTGKNYEATLMAYDINYDLAVIRFLKSTDLLSVVRMANSNPTHKIPVTVLGHPDGQNNAMTIGYYLDITDISLDEGSIGAIDFSVLKLDAPVQPGSSGSVVIDQDNQMIGLIFAGNFLEDAGYTNYSYAVPIEAVYDFLELYEWTGGESS